MLQPDQIRPLARALTHTTSSYKFLWLQALLDTAEQQLKQVALDDLLVAMVARAWKLTQFHRLRLGHYDQLQGLCGAIAERTGLPPNAAPIQVVRRLRADPELLAESRALARYVPQRFLAPWFERELRGVPEGKKHRAIAMLAARHRETERAAPYTLDGTGPRVILDPVWSLWARAHMTFLRAYVEREFADFLQDRNPGSPAVLRKIRGETRRNLARARRFWAPIISQPAGLRDFYAEAALEPGDAHYDHVLPWAFVAHDLLWNLVPTTSAINIAKSARVPDPDLYLERLARWQFEALQAQPGTALDLLIDHAEFLGLEEPRALRNLPQTDFSERFEDRFRPHLIAALNAGFAGSWRYDPAKP
ncbi:HNH endonuclease domain-containing protein [Phenylobacterium sp.]|uniref:HNH endonuclease domain-containing protein n=1 Tax=Phenylobacterium sp. TaxID=1871053 RepID=UPI003D29CDA5